MFAAAVDSLAPFLTFWHSPQLPLKVEIAMIRSDDLNKFVGLNIRDICGNNYVKPEDNHCAHFVSHALDYSFGYNCKIASAGATNTGANLRVHEIFSKCPGVGPWADRPPALLTCLVFVTAASNVHVATRSMDNVPRKHIGIFINGTIWHYSNSQHKVVTQMPVDFIKHYPGPGIELFYGLLIT